MRWMDGGHSCGISQGPRRGLGKVAQDAGVTFSHPYSSQTTKGPASAMEGSCPWAAEPSPPRGGLRAGGPGWWGLASQQHLPPSDESVKKHLQWK